MSALARWAEADDVPEDENLLIDDDTKLGENHEGIHLRRREQIDMPPPPPLVKKSTRKTTKFNLGERSLASPSTQKLKYRAITKRTTTTTSSAARLSTSSVSSTGSTGSSMANVMKNAETPEQMRRYLLAEVKQMSIERLVMDAKKFAFLETFYATHQKG
ncbi:hypothetical protein THRCLA_20605 [Thraustotheca clavata]|uniref:Uncharacterized protein n=1 Tax=Thraustotheca clavata TaxID=74557 RepID=A0A1W0A630_9STRA|nr:hypothetical protein THRCLA_20605 [Thraustotheca clavata]